MQYLLHKPCSALSHLVAHYWYWALAASKPIPDIYPGTGAELMLCLADPIVVTEPQPMTLHAGEALLVCPRRRRFSAYRTGRCELFSVRFRSAGLYPLFGVPLTHFSDQLVDASELLPPMLIEQLSASKPLQSKVRLLESWLMQQRTTLKCGEQALPGSIDSLYHQAYRGDFQRLLGDLQLSERTFQRRFKLFTGVDARGFESSARFQIVLKQILSCDVQDYFNIALDHGYYDQAHFIRDFKKRTGHTPASYFKQRQDLSAHYDQSIYLPPTR